MPADNGRDEGKKEVEANKQLGIGPPLGSPEDDIYRQVGKAKLRNSPAFFRRDKQIKNHPRQFGDEAKALYDEHERQASTRPNGKKSWSDPKPMSNLPFFRKSRSCDENGQPIESKEIRRARRRAKVRELLGDGKNITDVANLVGATRETIYRDMVVIGIEERTWTRKPGYMFSRLSSNYSFKIAILRRELNAAADAKDAVSIIEAMEKVDRGWIDFLFRSGTLEQSLGKVEVEHVMAAARDEIMVFKEVVMGVFKQHPEIWAQVKPQLDIRMAASRAKRVQDTPAAGADDDDDDDEEQIGRDMSLAL